MAVRPVSVNLIANVSGYVAGMNEAAKKTREMGTEAEKLAQKKQALGDLAKPLLAVGAIAAASFGIAVAKAADFDKAMSGVEAATHESAGNMALLRDAAIEAGASTVFTATEAANAIEELSKAGISTADILGGGLAGSLALASAGELSVADAAGIAATALTQFKLAGADVPHVADLLAAGAGKAMGSVEDLSQALNQGGLVASQTGLSIEETTGTLSAFAAAGLLGSDAGTSFKSMLQRLTPQSAEAKATMDELGISAYDAQGQFVGMEKFAGNLQDSLKDLSTEQRNSALATIFGSDAVRAASVLYSNGAEGIADWEEKVNDTGYAAETARIKLDNLSGDVEKLGGAFDTALIRTGSSANDTLRGLTQAATNAVDVVGSLPGPVLAVGLSLTGLVAVVGLAGGGFLTLVPKIQATRAAMTALDLTGKKVATGFAKGGAIAIAITSLASGFGALGQGVELTAEQMAKLDASLKTNNLYNLNAQFDTGRRGADGFAASLEQLYTGDFAKSEAANLGISRFLKGATFGLINVGTELERTESQFKQLGSALAAVVKDDFKKGTEGFNNLAKQTDGTKESTRQLLQAFPEYKAALIEVAAANGKVLTETQLLNFAQGKGKLAAEMARDATAKQALKLGDLSDVATDTREKIDTLADSIRNFGEQQFDTERASIAFNQSLADMAELLDSGEDGINGSLDITTEKGRATASTFLDMASSANDYAASLFAQGAPQEEVQAALEAGRQKIIETRVALGDSTEAAQAYADKLIATPTEISTAVKLNGLEIAQSTIDQFFANNAGRVLSIQTRATLPDLNGDVSGSGRPGLADGGPVAGVGGPREDNIPIWASAGEHMLDAEDVRLMGGHAGVYKFRASLYSGQGLADGGPVRYVSGRDVQAQSNPHGSGAVSSSSTVNSTLNVTAIGPDANEVANKVQAKQDWAWRNAG